MTRAESNPLDGPHGAWLRAVAVAAAATFTHRRQGAALAVAVAVARRADISGLASVRWNEVAAEIHRSRDLVGEYLAWMVNYHLLSRERPTGWGSARTGQYTLTTPAMEGARCLI